MGQAEAAALPVSSHLFIEASAHVLPVTPLAHYLEYLDIAGAVLADPPPLVDGHVTARGVGLGIEWDEEAKEMRRVWRVKISGVLAAPTTPPGDAPPGGD